MVKHSLQHTFGLIFAGILAGALLYTTLAFSWPSSAKNTQKSGPSEETAIVFTLPEEKEGEVHEENSQEMHPTIVYKALPKKNLTPSTILHADFGRLASALLLPTADFSDPKEQVHKTAYTNISFDQVKGIFSFYNPFTHYTLKDTRETFQLDQITNGSVYVGYEEDTTMVVYSIDLVGKLSFLDAGNTLTSMIIFPGMYVRFLPEKNHLLQNADLFSIVNALGSEENDVTTGIEFANARIKTETQDKFFMYRLPKETQPLFQMLHTLFGERAYAVDMLTQYAQKNREYYFPTSHTSIFSIQNPTKNFFHLLGKLQITLSKAVSTDITLEEFHTQLATILEESKQYKLENTVQKIIEQFLIDGRFVLYGNVAKEQARKYNELYTEAAKVLNIVPQTGTGEFFESLSNIFSKNLFNTKKVENEYNIYLMTTNAINTTLNLPNLNTKDYINLSFYASLLLSKMTIDGKSLNADLLTRRDTILYRLYLTIFKATQKYTQSILEKDIREKAQVSLAIKFYQPMMQLLVNALYNTFTFTQDGKIFLKKEFVKEGNPNLPNALTQDISKIFQSIYTIWVGELGVIENGKSYAYTKKILKEKIQEFQDFLDFVYKSDHQIHTEHPVSEDTASGSVLSENTASGSTASGGTTLEAEKKNIIAMFDSFLGEQSLTEEQIIKEKNGYALQFTFPEGNLSCNYIQGDSYVSGISLQFADMVRIHFLGTLRLDQLPEIKKNLSAYRNFIRATYQQNPQLQKEPLVFLYAQKKIQIGTTVYSVE